MTRAGRYSPEVKERAVRMVLEHEREHTSQWAAIVSIAGKIGCTPETLRKWVRREEIDTGRRGGLTSDQRARMKELERENRELRRANEILRKASAREADPSRLPERAQRDAVLEKEIQRVWTEHRRIYGARKAWRHLQREGFRVARCTVERLMRNLGLAGAVRGRRIRTTISDEAAARPADLVERNFTATRPKDRGLAGVAIAAKRSGP